MFLHLLSDVYFKHDNITTMCHKMYLSPMFSSIKHCTLWVVVGGAQVAIISKHPPATEGSRHQIAVYHAEGLVTPTLGSCGMLDLCLFRCLLNLDLQLLCLFTLIAQLACIDLFTLVCLPWTSIGPAVLLPLNVKTINCLSASVSLSTTWAQTNPLANTKFILNRKVMGHIHVWNI